MGPDFPVNLSTAPENQPVSLDTQAPGNPAPSANVAEVRSKKAYLSVGGVLRKSEGEIYSQVMAGQEKQLRAEAAARIDAINEQSRIQNIIDTAKHNNLTLTMDQMNAIKQKPTDPDRVFEDGYAAKVLDGIFKSAANMGDTALDSVVENVPGVFNRDLEKAKEHGGNYEYARTRQEDMAQIYENQGWLPWIFDQSKNIVPFYSDVKLRGWLKNQSAFDGWLQGNNLEEQTRALLRLPKEEFKTKLDEILNKLSNDNPSLALQYSNAVLGLSTSDVVLANVNNIIDITGLPGLTAVGKSLLRNVNTTRVALRDGIKSINTARPNIADVAEGFGDTATAAVERATQAVTDDITSISRPASNTANLNVLNDPIRRAKEALPTGFITDKENIAANPGPLSRELLNRILQQQDVASKNIIETIFDTAKVQRIPLEEASRVVMNRVKDEVREQHPGIRNAIADIGDPIYNQAGNNYHFPIKIFNWTGEQFANESEARRFARQYGIQEYDVVGKPGARYYIPEAAVKRPWESTPRLKEAIVKDGELKITLDDGAEVQASLKPAPGMIPIEVKGTEVKFHPTIKTEEDAAKAFLDQQGLGYHLVTFKPLDETQTVLKDLMVNLQSTKSIASKEGFFPWLNSIPGWGLARNSDNTLSPFEIHQRKTATYSVSRYQRLLQEEMKFVEDISRGRVRVDPVTGEDINSVKSYLAALNPANKIKAGQMYQDFKRFLEFAKDDLNPDTGKPGYFKRNPAEVNEWYLSNLNRSPTFQEYQAYFAFVRNYENDRVFRSMREYTNKARLGAEQHQVKFTDANGQKFESGYFDGVSKKQLPGGDYPILILSGGSSDLQMTSKLGSKYKTLAKDVTDGKVVVIEPYNPDSRPLKGIPGAGNSYIRYVAVEAGNKDTKGLDWNQVNRLSGGHFEYDYGHAVKEAKMTRTKAGATVIDRYEGDRTFMFVDNPAMGQNVVNVLNEVKKLLKSNKVKEAKAVFEEGLRGETGPAMQWKEFYSKTKSVKDENGILHPPVININEPFHVVSKGKSILDIDKSLENRYKVIRPNNTEYSTFQDGTKSGSLSRQYQVGYTQERDADNMMAIRDIGGKGNPIYKYEPAKFVDPITTMNRALNQITRASFMDDMKIAAVEGWLREAEPYLKASESEVRSSPWYHFHNAGNESAFKSDADRVAKQNLLSNRFKTQQFLGVPSKWDVFTHDTADRLAANMYDKMGPKGSLVPTWAFTKLTSPIDMLKSLAYHTKLGLFALPQLLTQSMTYLTIASVAPRSAPAGTFATLLHQWSRFAANPELLNTLDNLATKLRIPGLVHGFKPGEWLEAMKELDRRGFAHIGGEYGPLDTVLNHQYVKGMWGDILDKGQVFFKGAERNVRLGAWYTAAKEYRAEHPNIKVMSRTDWDKVLDRADDMSGNMSRASSSILQSGPLSLTGQFLTYQMHLAEFFWSKRLDPLSKMRMFATYTAAFGAGGIGITGLPVGEWIKKQLQEGNVPGVDPYVVGNNPLLDAVVQGVPALFLAWATSPDGDPKKGNWYNISDRLGAGGFTQFKDLFSDKPFLTFVGGAASSIAANTWQNSAGLRKATFGNWLDSIGSMMTGNPKQEAFPMKMADWVDIFKEVSSVNAIWKGAYAVEFGKWLSKNEQVQTNVSSANAIFMSLTGLNLQEVADNYVVGQSIKDQHEKQKQGLNKFVEEFQRGITAANNDDYNNYKDYMTRAFGWLKASNYPIEKYSSAISIASKGWEERISSIREEFYTKNVPAGKEDKYMDAYRKFLRRHQ